MNVHSDFYNYIDFSSERAFLFGFCFLLFSETSPSLPKKEFTVPLDPTAFVDPSFHYHLHATS